MSLSILYIRDGSIHTPGDSAMTVKPSFPNSKAYCTVSMFNAALLTLYAGVGAMTNLEAWEIDPMLVDLETNRVSYDSRLAGHASANDGNS